MGYEWEEDKAASNLLKHGIASPLTITVFDDSGALVSEDEDSDEQRFVLVGMTYTGELLVVVYTHRGENIRIISARKATKAERREYEES